MRSCSSQWVSAELCISADFIPPVVHTRQALLLDDYAGLGGVAGGRSVNILQGRRPRHCAEPCYLKFEKTMCSSVNSIAVLCHCGVLCCAECLLCAVLWCAGPCTVQRELCAVLYRRTGGSGCDGFGISSVTTMVVVFTVCCDGLCSTPTHQAWAQQSHAAST